jgi:hypothetical protein
MITSCTNSTLKTDPEHYGVNNRITASRERDLDKYMRHSPSRVTRSPILVAYLTTMLVYYIIDCYEDRPRGKDLKALQALSMHNSSM